MNGPEVALFCPGQASQFVGMARQLATAYPEADKTLRRAEEAAGFDLRHLCFEGPAEKLALTEFQQPCVLAATVAAFRVLETELGLRFVCAAGHSLGEYSALVAARSLTLEHAVALVRKRGQLMQKAVAVGDGAMAALIGNETIDASGLCEEVSLQGDACWPANYNSPKQIVISGHKPAIERAIAKARQFGARRAVLLNVSAPFHTPLMHQASVEFAEQIEHVPIQPPQIDVYSNVNALIHDPDPKVIAQALVKQFYSPVLFDKIGKLIAKRIPTGWAIECGPGRVLTGMMPAIAPDFMIVPFGLPQDLATVKEKLV